MKTNSSPLGDGGKYKHLFFDLDHTLWDFEANARATLEELYTTLSLEEKGINDFNLFYPYQNFDSLMQQSPGFYF